MRARSRLASIALGVGLVVSPTRGGSQEVDFSTWTVAQKETFLRQAEPLDFERLEVGVTGSFRVRLRDAAGIEHDAHWQTVDAKFLQIRIRGRLYRDFKDSYLFNVAAYELDRLLGLEMVPVTVLRRIKGRGEGALTWWVDDVLMMEGERAEQGIVPPKPLDWLHQTRRFRCFTQLVGNIDANAGNLLIASDWRIWLIDFTRAFRTHVRLLDEPRLASVDEAFLDALGALDRRALRESMRGLLTSEEQRTLLWRRDRIVEQLSQAPDSDDVDPER